MSSDSGEESSDFEYSDIDEHDAIGEASDAEVSSGISIESPFVFCSFVENSLQIFVEELISCVINFHIT